MSPRNFLRWQSAAVTTECLQDRVRSKRRITELYTKAADQLGSDQAPVRLAGLYALERLAHSTAEHRQTIVDVICAYLRMPYTPPPPETPQVGTHYGDRAHGAADSPSSTITTSQSEATPTDQHQQSRQEREVRLTAQGILARNLRLPDLPDESRRRRWAPWRGAYREPSWPGIRLNLNRALLLDVSLESCWIAEADFIGTQFIGLTDFNGARFTGGANFEGARFTGMAYFAGARFTGETYFEGARFTGETYFTGARFTGETCFAGAQFVGGAHFYGAQFYVGALDALEGARVSGPGLHQSVWPPGWTTRPGQPDKGEDPAFRYLVRGEDPAG